MADMTEELRPLLFSIAYRMLGSVGDAEDVVQEAFLRAERAEADGTRIESRKAYLTTVTTRLAIDELKSARARRETYVGPWLPEPLLTSTEPDAAEHAEMADSLSISFLVLLETLSPVERAVFLLREVFDYGYDEIAEVVGKSEANCRQILVRARKRIDEGRPRFEADRRRQEQLARRFLEAFEEGDVDGFVELLADDVVFVGDGGGKGRGISRPVYGQRSVIRLLSSFLPPFRAANARVRLGVDSSAALLMMMFLLVTVECRSAVRPRPRSRSRSCDRSAAGGPGFWSDARRRRPPGSCRR